MKKNRLERFESAFKNLSRSAYNANLTFKKFLEVIEVLDEKAKKASETGMSLRVQLLNETGK
jgi:hypothetical protein